MARLIWTNRALDDLERVLEFIEKDAPMAAIRFAEHLFARVEQLAQYPSSGSLIAEDASQTYREILQGSYRVIYRREDEIVYLVAVHHASRLLDTSHYTQPE